MKRLSLLHFLSGNMRLYAALTESERVATIQVTSGFLLKLQTQ